jgi:hypothetical protein
MKGTSQKIMLSVTNEQYYVSDTRYVSETTIK